MTKLGGWGIPGQGSLDITTEKQLLWGYGSVNNLAVLQNAVIDGTSRDGGNTPTNVLRPGLVLGKITSTGLYKQYSPTATDGTQVARAINYVEVLAQDFTGTNSNRVAPVLVSGPVVAGQLLGLDGLARAQLRRQFIFDDNYQGAPVGGPPQAVVAKTLAYQVALADNGTTFTNAGAVASVTFTLPAIANGYWFRFVVEANQNVLISSTETGNMVVFNNAAASTVAFQTPGQLIGGVCTVWSDPAAALWIVELPCKNAVTIS